MPRSARRFAPALGIAEITPEAVTQRLSYRLQKLVGTGRRWSYLGVSALTQIDVRTLKAYAQGTACPNLVKYKRLLAVLGPEIGIELNLMKGWMPRSDVVPPEALDLEDLRTELAHAIGVLEDVLPEQDLVPPGGSTHSLPGAPAPSADDDQFETLPEFRSPLRVEDIDVAAVASRLSYRLRTIIGPNGPWELGQVADATGIDRRTLQSYLDGTACPNLARFHRLGRLLGPQVGVELAFMIGWEPRYGQSLLHPREHVHDLYRALAEAVAAIQRLQPTRLIRRNDGVTGGGLGRKPVFAIEGIDDDIVETS